MTYLYIYLMWHEDALTTETYIWGGRISIHTAGAGSQKD